MKFIHIRNWKLVKRKQFIGFFEGTDIPELIPVIFKSLRRWHTLAVHEVVDSFCWQSCSTGAYSLINQYLHKDYQLFF